MSLRKYLQNVLKRSWLLFIYLPILGAQGVNFENAPKWAPTIARYVYYILLIRGTQELCRLIYNQYTTEKIDFEKVFKDNRRYFIIFAVAVAILLYANATVFIAEDFLLLFIAFLISQYPEIESQKAPEINYGVGMACSFFEGYLVHVIPNDGAKFVGFEVNIRALESQGVVFPCKKLFIIIPKWLYSPPDLKQHNKDDDTLPYIEAIKSMEDVIKDVAGVKNRTYRNSAYRITRRGGAPVYLAAEFATPLHTLHRVLEKRSIYHELCDVDVPRIVSDFRRQLQQTIDRSFDCKGKCVLVDFDEKTQYLPNVLLDKIAEVEPRFEEIIERGIV